MHDETPFSMVVAEHDVELNDEFTSEKSTVDGWLFVTQEAQQDTRCYLTLPKPTLQFGKQVVVHELQLMPLNAKIEDFRPKTLEKSKPAAKKSTKTRKNISK